MNERTRLRKTGLRRRGSLLSASCLLAVLAGTLSCGGDGSTAPTPPPPPPPPPPPAPPAAVGTMPAQSLEAGASVTVDASGYFRDPNGDALTYAAASSDERVAEATVSASQVMVAGIGPGTATVTVTASDPGGLSATQGFGVVVSGSVEDDFDSPASLNDWASTNAEATVADGALNLTNQTQGRLGIAERREMPAVSEWTIMARMGRTARRASPGVVSLTRHGRFTAVRLVLRTLDDDDDRDRDRAADTATGTRNYEFAVFDGAAGEWVLVTNLSGGSGSVFETPGEFTDLTLGHEGGDFVAYAGEMGASEELFRFDLATSQVDGVGLGEIVSDVTGVWLVNQAEPGLTAQHDRVRITGTGSDATPPDAAVIAEAPDGATRSISVSGPDADRAALVALYEATDGPNWVNSENWLTDAPIGDWYGVDTDESGRVVSISLRGRYDGDSGELIPHGLSGPIPPELANLTSLRSLWVDGNELTGEIPPEVGSLIHLDALVLSNNSLTGGIPSELINLTRLTFLLLGGNQLTGPIPPTLSNLAELDNLDLAFNSFGGPIPSELAGLANLRTLRLHNNKLTGEIPPELGGLANLNHLSLNDNDLSGEIPPELGNLASLVSLGLHRTGVTGSIPPELGRLANLTHLQLDGNDLSGEIPPELGSLTSLTDLYVFDNRLMGQLPESLLQLSLTWFWWFNNAGLCAPPTPAFRAWIATIAEQRGPFCSDASDREALVALYQATDGPNWGNNENWLTDAPLGDWYGVHTDASGRVVRLWLMGIGLSGPIPPELGSLAGLEELRLNNNNLTGEIPGELGNLTNLTGLNLSGNNLTGEIPPRLGNLTRLEYLNLRTNDLTGGIPAWLGDLVSLEQLDLNYNENMAAGGIPSELGGLANLEFLALQRTARTGEIPPELGNLASLEYLDLGFNNLTGEIPPELGNLTGLKILSLWANRELAGEIPAWLGSLDSLEQLYLGFNNLTGGIPPELGNLASLEILRLTASNLTGEIPPELGSLANLSSLRLDHNSLTGQLPVSFLDLPLSDFRWNGNPNLCAPDTSAFRTWMDGIGDHQPGPFCSASRGSLDAPYEDLAHTLMGVRP